MVNPASGATFCHCHLDQLHGFGKKFNSLRGAVAQIINIAHTHLYLIFQYCLDETISQYTGAPACFFVNFKLFHQ